MLDFNRGIKYLDKNNGPKAAAIFKKILKVYPRKEVYLNLGNAYRMMEQESLATEMYLLAAKDDIPFLNGSYGTYAIAYNNLGLQEYTLGNMDAAASFYLAAMKIDPTYGEAAWNLCTCELKYTNCTDGWDKYKYRFSRGPTSVKRVYTLPDWDMISYGDSICVQAEQGLGDKIMFGRYLSILDKYFKKVYVMCAPVLDVFYSGYTCCRAPIGDCMIPMGSLIERFGIVSSESAAKRIEGINAIERKGFNIAVCWSGSTGHANNKYRSCPSHFMSTLSNLGSLYSLDPSGNAAKNITPLSPSTWSDTIAYMKGMQLVISVDTSIVHLAGTLGIPCLMLQPLKNSDYRWGMPGDKNVWYSSVNVIDNNNWVETFDRVREIVKVIKC